jgi:hypothetical protein
MLAAALASLGGSGGAIDVPDAVVRFLWVSLGGAGIGVGFGWLTARLIARIDDYLIETTLTTVLAFGSYLLAERLHVSGVLAVRSGAEKPGSETEPRSARAAVSHRRSARPWRSQGPTRGCARPGAGCRDSTLDSRSSVPLMLQTEWRNAPNVIALSRTTGKMYTSGLAWHQSRRRWPSRAGDARAARMSSLLAYRTVALGPEPSQIFR